MPEPKNPARRPVAASAPQGGPDQLAPPPPALWDRLDAAARTARTTLTHEQIAQAAIALADAEGLAAVSMRKLAERLGVATMALYRYVATKDELLELMIDRVGEGAGSGTGVEPTAARDAGGAEAEAARAASDPTAWRDFVLAAASARRSTALAHPWIVEAQALVPNPLTPSRAAGLDRMVGLFGALGLDGDALMRVIRAIDAYVRGAIAGEVNQRLLMERRGLGQDGDFRLALRSNMHWLLNSGRAPRFAELVRSGLQPPDEAADFRMGLECLLDGLAVRYGL